MNTFSEFSGFDISNIAVYLMSLFFRCFLGAELLKSNNEGNESLLKSLWHHSDAILCCTLKVCLKLISNS
jgi:hypothetical protein